MDEVSTMTVPPPLPAKTQSRDGNQVARQTVSIRAVSPPSSPALSTGAGATVFVGSRAVDPPASTKRRIPEVQTANGYGRQSNVQQHQEQQQQHQQQQQQQQHYHYHQQRQQASHVVKIKINPDGDKNGKVISTVRLTLDDNEKRNNGVTCERSSNSDGAVPTTVSATNLVNEKLRESGVVGEGCVRISVGGDASRDKKSFALDQDTANNNNEINKNGSSDNDREKNGKDMVQRVTSETPNSSPLTNRSSGCFYYNSYQNPLNAMVMSSGQCSPSDTLDSGTCSDLDGTPPPLPKKKNTNKGAGGGTTVILSVGQHDRTGSLTSSGAELDSDDNESNISCDSLNGGELNGRIVTRNVNGTKSSNENVQENAEYRQRLRLRKNDLGAVVVKDIEERVNTGNEETEELDHRANDDDFSREDLPSPTASPSPSGTSSLSKASSTPRIRSPEPFVDRNGSGTASPVVRECTYEERKQEQERIEQEHAAAEFYANYNRSSGNKYVYDDDRFYKFHVNELRNQDSNEDSGKDSKKEAGALGEKETDECFAGYKILEREAIRSAKGTVRGVKNRVRAGIATFLQKPSSKAYKAKEEGKVVVYTTSSGIVRLTFYNCMKVKQILNTHMVKYDEKDLFRSAELQTELRDRIGCTAIQVPQLFVNGQYIGDADTVERLNESGELRRMLKPYQSDGACPSCLFCGNYRLLVCPVCNGSKRSVLRNDFTVEFVALKCMNCDETGLVPCQHC